MGIGVSSSLREIASGVNSGKYDPGEVADYFLDRIAKINPSVNAFTSSGLPNKANLSFQVDQLRQRLKAGEDLPLAGVPIGIKDNICTNDYPTTAGSRILENYTPPFDATVVARLRGLGAIIFGKLNLDEFAMGSSSETSFFGPVKNPWNLDLSAGGSSGGSAAAVAAGMVPAALGSDTGGSIRQPASFCGVSGIKPSYGSWSRNGLISYASSLDQIGPLARTVDDLCVLMEAVTGKDVLDSTSQSFTKKADDGCRVQDFKIGVLETADLDSCVAENFADVKKCLEASGAVLTAVDLRSFDFCVPTYYLIAMAEASSNLSRYDGVRYGQRSQEFGDGLDDLYKGSRSKLFGDEVKKRIIIGSYVLSEGYKDQFYHKANQVRHVLRSEYNYLMKDFDFIISPTSPTSAFPLGEAAKDTIKTYKSDEFTILSNLIGCPSISVPSGFDKNGIPIGLQIMGGVGEDMKLLNGALAYEQASGYFGKISPKFA